MCSTPEPDWWWFDAGSEGAKGLSHSWAKNSSSFNLFCENPQMRRVIQ